MCHFGDMSNRRKFVVIISFFGSLGSLLVGNFCQYFSLIDLFLLVL